MLLYNQKDIRHITAYAIKESINLTSRRIRFIISTDKIDRDNEIIEVSAIAAAIPNFATNPVFVASHKHRTENAEPTVIGSWDIGSYEAKAHQSEMDAVFGETKLAEQYWLNYSKFHQRAVSVGFIPIEGYVEKTKDGNIYHHTKIELLEISAVAVGSNRQALSKEFGEELDAEFKAMSKEVSELKTFLNEQFDDIKSLLIHDSDGFAKGLLLGGSDDSSSAVNKDKSEQKAIRAVEKAIEHLT